MDVDDLTFNKIDDGSPGKLAGAWLFFNRMRNGELGNPRNADNARKTMKILSGTRFQWIAYNVETKEFMGTGGGTYTTIDGKYTENIDFSKFKDQKKIPECIEIINWTLEGWGKKLAENGFWQNEKEFMARIPGEFDKYITVLKEAFYSQDAEE